MRTRDGEYRRTAGRSLTAGLPKGAMISQRALTECVRLMPSLFRISSYGRCAFTGTLSFVSGTLDGRPSQGRELLQLRKLRAMG